MMIRRVRVIAETVYMDGTLAIDLNDGDDFSCGFGREDFPSLP